MLSVGVIEILGGSRETLCVVRGAILVQSVSFPVLAAFFSVMSALLCSKRLAPLEVSAAA